MLLTRLIRKQGTQSTVLQEQYKRLFQLTNFTLPSTQFWLGYISSYSSAINSMNNKPFTIEQWKQLSEAIQIAMNASHDQVIKTQNVYQLIIYALCSQISAREGGANINKVSQSIKRYLEELALDTRYLKNRFFTNQPPRAEINKLKSSQKKFIQPPSKIQKTQSIGLGIQCPICVQQINLETVCPISCGHNLHKSCFIQHFKTKVQNKKFPICCPQEGCGIQINIQDLQQYIPKELLQKFYEFSLHQFVDKNNKNTNWCPTPGCSTVFSFDGQVINYNCIGCKKQYCLKCKTESHHGFTCQRNKEMLNLPEDQKQFINFAKGAKMKQCPSCKFWVEKNKGCDHMTCRCGYEFCFRCGAKYGQGQCSCDQNNSFYGNDSDEEEDESIQPYRQEEEQDDQAQEDRTNLYRQYPIRQPINLGRGRGRIFHDVFARQMGVRIGGGDQGPNNPNLPDRPNFPIRPQRHFPMNIRQMYRQRQEQMEDNYQSEQKPPIFGQYSFGNRQRRERQ